MTFTVNSMCRFKMLKYEFFAIWQNIFFNFLPLAIDSASPLPHCTTTFLTAVAAGVVRRRR